MWIFREELDERRGMGLWARLLWFKELVVETLAGERNEGKSFFG